MPKFRKKPVIIDAFQLNGGDYTEAPDWLREAFASRRCIADSRGIAIETLEGTMVALSGSWIIRGVKGEIYPCKPDIFAATYEPVE